MRTRYPSPLIEIAGGVLRTMLQRGIQRAVREGIRAMIVVLATTVLAGATRVDVLQRVYLSLF